MTEITLTINRTTAGLNSSAVNANVIHVGASTGTGVINVESRVSGPQGADGAPGAPGADGEGVPVGGTTNQALTKNSATNYDTEWTTIDKTFVGLANVPNTDATARANHTGTQLLATISDVTASAAEVNIMDGITSTTTELNYTDGVTSAIQTQLNTKAVDADVVHDTGAETIAGVKTFSSDPLIPDEAYGVGWNGSLGPPTKNAVYDKIETISAGSGISESLALAYAIAL